MATEIVGTISPRVAELLSLNGLANGTIYLGETNIAHMQACHPTDYEKYGASIALILKEPDYVGKNEKDGSIEYVKEFLVDHEYVKVAVRVSLSGRLFARSLYVLNRKRVENFIAKGTLKKT